MKINLQELLPIQEKVNETVIERIGHDVMLDQFILAFQIELFEYFNAIGTWKWWKKNHDLNKEKILDELADCFAFFLSIILKAEEISNKKGNDSVIEVYEKEVQDNLNNLLKNQKEDMQDPQHLINNWILIIGANHETEYKIFTVQRFAIAIFLATQLFEGITWKEITDAYRKKSDVNIKRQEEGY